MDAYNEFMTIVQGDRTTSTYNSYRWNLDNFINKFNLVTLEDLKKLTTKDIREYLEELKTSGLQSSSVNTRLRTLKTFFAWLMNEEYIKSNPMTKIKTYIETKKIATILTAEERENIISMCRKNIKLKLMVSMMLYAGLRREEIVNIKLGDITGCHLLVHGKGRKERLLALHPYVCDLLNQYLAKRATDFEYLFCSRKAGFGTQGGEWHKITPQAVYDAIKKACRLAGIDEVRVAPHTLRRTFSCDLARGGASSFQIQKALGHSSIITTERYLSAAGAEIADSALLNQPSPKDGNNQERLKTKIQGENNG
jgi:integrase/recombinase XerD